MLKKPNLVVPICLFIFFVLLLPPAIIGTYNQDRVMINKWNKTECTVTKVYGTSKNKRYLAYYIDNDRNRIDAELKAEKQSFDVGEKVTAYVNPDNKYEVRAKHSKWFFIVTFVVSLSGLLVGIGALAFAFSERKNYKLLTSRGYYGVAQIDSVSREWHGKTCDYNTVFKVYINDKTYEYRKTIDEKYSVGDSVNIVYAFDDKGNFVMDLLENK